MILGCRGPRLTPGESSFFMESDPLGFILFARNCETPEQVAALVTELRASVGRADAPVLIDQEGGRVQRLKPPYWRAAPSPSVFGELAAMNPASATRAAWLNARLIGADLADLGITVNCTPLLDLRIPAAHDVIGDRSFGSDPGQVAQLGRAVCDGLMAAGVLPVVKHLPGHGRARVDSHHALPIVPTTVETLREQDLRPFAMLPDVPWGMTAHVVYTAFDAANPATTSATVIGRRIRAEIGFDGVLISDDLSMKALDGGLAQRAADALAAGCDLVLHCNGDLIEMRAIAEGTGDLTAATSARIASAEKRRYAAIETGFDRESARRALDALLAAE